MHTVTLWELHASAFRPPSLLEHKLNHLIKDTTNSKFFELNYNTSYYVNVYVVGEALWVYISEKLGYT